ncbi:immunoglobulin superfamily member 10-like [Saccostrea echinata]|uniref:immunoglobulin superfamily member 10-like n=1 Tax=Saccostrea echinata TaxID=191078 RepID=UPI002A7FCF02|nr:immunoglobulin superfamily member 10-like [Saccostrea echinata]
MHTVRLHCDIHQTGQKVYISAEFSNGRLIFKWTNVSTIRNEIIITKDSQSSLWMSVYDDQYTVEDVMQYKSVTIRVREYKSANPAKGHNDYKKTYNATDRHVYHTRPLNSTNILIEVKNITVEDAGYYVGGQIKAEALSGEGGVVLIVSGKPMKPIIKGKLNVKAGDNAFLNCESKSTSAPYYYKKFPQLSYSWFVNNTKLERENRETYSFNVTKDIKYNRYSCQAKETLESEKSEDIWMNPLFNTIKSEEGESRNISWTATYFPRTGLYFIFHVYNDSVSEIIKIDNAILPSTEKYVFHTRPYNSTNILFEVRNITVEDAGYYVGNPTKENAWSGESGVVLTVSGKPVQPIIRGDRNVSLRYPTYLKCESRSTSAPEYYMKFPSLSYSWFVNGTTKLEHEISEIYRFNVSKDVKYNRYSCQAKETLQSVRSKEIRIYPLYGPEIVKITPLRPTDDGGRLKIKEGDTFGPYNCSADCNPPCTLQWKYKNTSGHFVDAPRSDFSSTTLLEQKANRSKMTQIQCIAKNSEGRNEQNIVLNILYILKPKILLNGSSDNRLNITEGEYLHISCYVDGNPIPTINLTRSLHDKILGAKNKHWRNHTILNTNCSDTDTYTCTGKSSQLGNVSTEFTLNVHCKFSKSL